MNFKMIKTPLQESVERRKVIVMHCFSAILRNCVLRISVVVVAFFFPLKTFAELNIAIEKGDGLDFIFKLLT